MTNIEYWISIGWVSFALPTWFLLWLGYRMFNKQKMVSLTFTNQVFMIFLPMVLGPLGFIVVLNLWLRTWKQHRGA